MLCKRQIYATLSETHTFQVLYFHMHYSGGAPGNEILRSLALSNSLKKIIRKKINKKN